MSLRTGLLYAGLLIGILAPTIPLRAEETPTVRISEVAWAGSLRNTADEWIELVNLSDEPFDVSGWVLTGAGTGGRDFVIPEQTILEPRSTFVIANFNADDTRSVLAQPPNLASTFLSLPNEGLEIVLRDASGEETDRAGDGRLPLAGQSAEPRSSMERVCAICDGGETTSWITAPSASGFDADVTDRGTPGSSLLLAETDPAVLSEPIETPPTDAVAPVEVSEPTDADLPPVEAPPAVLMPEQIESMQTPAPDNSLPISGGDGSPEPEDAAESSAALTQEQTDSMQTAAPDNSIPVTGGGGPNDETESTTAAALAPPPPPAPELPTAPPAPSPTPNKHVGPFAPGTLRISEIVPDPIKGQTEWTEVENPNEHVLSLAGWALKESSGRRVALPDIQLSAHSFTVVMWPSGSLNNDTDQILLLDPTGTIVDEVVYGTSRIPTAPDPQSVIRLMDGTFAATITPTLMGANVLTRHPEPVAAPPVEATTQTTPASAPTDAPELPVAKSATTSNPPLKHSTTQSLNDFSRSVHLVTLLPNPTETQEEYIELWNAGSSAAVITGWKLRDASGRSRKAPEIVLQPNERLALTQEDTKVALNNTQPERIEWIAPDGIVMEIVTYDRATRGARLQRSGEQWVWESLPVESRVQKAITKPSAKRTSVKKKSTASKPKPTVSTTPVSTTAATETRTRGKADAAELKRRQAASIGSASLIGLTAFGAKHYAKSRTRKTKTG